MRQEIKIAKTLKQATEMGPEHVADLIRQKLTLLQFHLDEGVDPQDAIQAFMKNLGMDEFPAIPAEIQEFIQGWKKAA